MNIFWYRQKNNFYIYDIDGKEIKNGDYITIHMEDNLEKNSI